jgi:hypothetical protein
LNIPLPLFRIEGSDYTLHNLKWYKLEMGVPLSYKLEEFSHLFHIFFWLFDETLEFAPKISSFEKK